MRVKSSILIAFVAIALVACGGGEKRGSSTFDAAAELAKVKQARLALTTVRTELAAARQELEALKVQGRLSAEESARQTELEAQVKELEAQVDEAFSADQSAVASFLNVALNDLPDAPETLEALRLYSDEAIINAQDRIDKAGDYGRAIEQLETAKGYFEAISSPAPADLQAALDRANEMRYLSKERFDQLKRGMTEEQVKEITGTPFYANIRESEVRGKTIVTWLFTRDDGGIAAVYFDKGKIYSTTWDLKKN